MLFDGTHAYSPINEFFFVFEFCLSQRGGKVVFLVYVYPFWNVLCIIYLYYAYLKNFSLLDWCLLLWLSLHDILSSVFTIRDCCS